MAALDSAGRRNAAAGCRSRPSLQRTVAVCVCARASARTAARVPRVEERQHLPRIPKLLARTRVRFTSFHAKQRRRPSLSELSLGFAGDGPRAPDCVEETGTTNPNRTPAVAPLTYPRKNNRLSFICCAFTIPSLADVAGETAASERRIHGAVPYIPLSTRRPSVRGLHHVP